MEEGGNGRREWKRHRREIKKLPFPRKRESRGAASSATHRRRRHCTSASRNFPHSREEIPAFAGMERGREWKGGAGMERGAGMEKLGE